MTRSNRILTRLLLSTRRCFSAPIARWEPADFALFMKAEGKQMSKILHYLNQFFAGIGGEDKAGQEFLFLTHGVGPGVVLRDLLKNPEVEYATVVCGDNYFHENEEAVLASLMEVMNQFAPDLFI